MPRKRIPQPRPIEYQKKFADFADRWEDTILVLKKKATIQDWKRTLYRMRIAFRGVRLEDMNYFVIQSYFTKRAKRGLKPSTIHSEWHCLSSLLNQAVREGLLAKVAKPVLPRLNRPRQDYFRLEEIHGLLMTARDPYYTFYFMLAENGARIGEALAVKVKSVDLRGKKLKIEESLWRGELQDPKTESSKRTIYISDYLAGRLAVLMHGKAPNDFIFANPDGSPWTYSAALAIFQGYQVLAGIEPIGFHAFRRSNITYCTKRLHIPEGILGFRVGHLSGGMTLGVYLQDMDDSDKPWRNKIAAMLLQDEVSVIDDDAISAATAKVLAVA